MCYEFMIKKLIYPFQLFIQELRKDYAFRKTLDNTKLKAMILGAMGQTCIALFGLTVMYAYTVYAVGVIIYTLDLVGLIASLILPLMIWFWTSMCKKILIKNKIAYLKENNLYEQYKEATKSILEKGQIM